MAQAFLIALHRTNNQAANNPQRFVNAQVIRTSHALNAHFLIPKRSGFGCKSTPIFTHRPPHTALICLPFILWSSTFSLTVQQ